MAKSHAASSNGGDRTLIRIIAGCLGAVALLQASASIAATIELSAHDIGGQGIGEATAKVPKLASG